MSGVPTAHALEQLNLAVATLATSPAPLRDRLAEAIAARLFHLSGRKLGQAFARELEAILTKATAAGPPGNVGAIERTLARMPGPDLERLAAAVVALCFDVADQHYDRRTMVFRTRA